MAGSLFSNLSRDALWSAKSPTPADSRFSYLDILILTTGGGIAAGVLALWLTMRTAPLFLFLNGIFLLVLGGIWVARSRLSSRVIRLLLFGVFWVHYTIIMLFTGGVHSPMAGMMLILIYVSGLLLGFKGSLVSIVLGAGVLLLSLSVEQAGLLPSSTVPITPVMEVLFRFLIGAIFILIVYFTNHMLANYQRMLEIELAQRQATQNALALQTAQMQMVLEKSFDAFILIDETGRVAEWNPGAERLLGYPRAEMQGQATVKVLEHIALPAYRTPPALSKLTRAFTEALKTGKSPFFNRKTEARFLHASGQVRICELNSFALPTPQGYRIGMVLRDVTVEREAQEQLRLRLKHLEALNRISTLAREQSQVTVFLERVMDILLETLDAPAGGIAQVDRENQCFQALAVRGWAKPFEGKTFPLRGGLVEKAFERDYPIFSEDLHNDPGSNKDITRLIPAGWRAVLAPLRAGQEHLGVLLISVEHPRLFTEAEVRLVQTAGDIIGSVLRRAQLDAEVHTRLEQLASLHEIDTAISSSHNLKATANILLQQCLRTLKVDAALLYEFDPLHFHLDCVATMGLNTTRLEHIRVRPGESLVGKAMLEGKLSGGKVEWTTLPEGSHDRLMWEKGFQQIFTVPLVSKSRVVGVLEVCRRKVSPAPQEWLELLNTLAGQAAIAIENARLFEDLQRTNAELTTAYDATLEGWALALGLRDSNTEDHTRRVVEASVELGKAMGLSHEDLIQLRRGAILHDIGKLGIPDTILLKPSFLTEEEREIMRRHTLYAREWLARIPYLRPAMDIPTFHHEHWDGSGYPYGLRGEQIPLAARIFSVVDVWDALSTDRPYRKAWPREKVLQYIQAQAGLQFDPQVVKTFVQIIDRVEKILEKGHFVP
ncbi:MULTISPECIES: HD domain-containing phosphohydrolase [Anaerolinea]|uniref:HD domain-containing phosphohydrolase n=1 Tax=Anaerolinea TaxID=233189 RepID=UPI0026147B9A|nr:HD domain-containing phosphohydrolase [Anaerolinea thermophila]